MAVDVIAIDWSGRIDGERRTIWTAHAREGRLISLENGRRRAEVIDHVIAEAARFERLVVGLDFAFSFPAWFLTARGLTSVHALWELVGLEGEEWLSDCPPPFWGKPGRKKPISESHYRATEREFPAVAGVQAKSVFQVGGAGAVGTGSLRGMPFLGRLRNAGFSVWPFHEMGWPRAVEIYPRLLTGPVVKSSQSGRETYLEAHFPSLGVEVAQIAASTEDAFDAAVSALVMSDRAEELERLAQDTEMPGRLEGQIWCPDGDLGAQNRPPLMPPTLDPRPAGSTEITAQNEHRAYWAAQRGLAIDSFLPVEHMVTWWLSARLCGSIEQRHMFQATVADFMPMQQKLDVFARLRKRDTLAGQDWKSLADRVDRLNALRNVLVHGTAFPSVDGRAAGWIEFSQATRLNQRMKIKRMTDADVAAFIEECDAVYLLLRREVIQCEEKRDNGPMFL